MELDVHTSYMHSFAYDRRTPIKLNLFTGPDPVYTLVFTVTGPGPATTLVETENIPGPGSKSEEEREAEKPISDEANPHFSYFSICWGTYLYYTFLKRLFGS